ncbi:matrixin family metalloprotease [Acinetobacter suaedae]|uniref:Matrixin family metalloprotease n=1 Tax=Acinetobacter suaedae TaxID=2609668 RepID=A0A5P1UY11_9GAMM|nr:matrixin family metalloprotease [Acinetobacter sp. C16S1]QER41042.1 matrixin family metalloprotease [Acinetobacter sp. C16S1]
MVRLLFFLGLLLLILWSGYQSHQHPQLKFNSLLDRMTHPFDTRLRYRIAEVDPRFKLSLEQVQEISQQAAKIWKDGTGRDYFVYDPNAQLAIHLIYDERQIESEQRRTHLNQLEANQQQWRNKKQQLDHIEQELLETKQYLNLKRQQLDQQIQQYNQEKRTAHLNPMTGAYQQHLKEKQQNLQYNIETLKQEVSEFNQKISKLNQKVDELNALDQQLHDSVKEYKQRFQPHLFHKGLFNGKQIIIYEFESIDDLRLTLAHEFGHALGLQHTDDPTALMHPILKEQNFTDFRLTQTDRDLLKAR